MVQPTWPPPGFTLHVAPRGNDAGKGSATEPFASLDRDRGEIRARRQIGSLPAGGVEVLVHGGEYQVSQTLSLSASDSGTESAPVVFRAVAGENPTFRGGTRLKGWRQLSDADGYLQHPAGTMPRFCAYFDTDYEFALNKVGDAYGGGTEIFCLQRPGMMRKHFFPRQPKAPIDGGPVKGEAKLVVKDNIVECAIPWSQMPEVKQRLDARQTVKFSFRVNNGGGAFELAAGRSVSKDNPLAFHNDWATHWANEVEFGWEP